jgi:hypothetical protein
VVNSWTRRAKAGYNPIMAEHLIPPPGLAPPGATGTKAKHGIALWIEVMDAYEQEMLAGLRQEVGPSGDLQAAYRAWYAREMEEHDRMMVRLMENLARRSCDHVAH